MNTNATYYQQQIEKFILHICNLNKTADEILFLYVYFRSKTDTHNLPVPISYECRNIDADSEFIINAVINDLRRGPPIETYNTISKIGTILKKEDVYWIDQHNKRLEKYMTYIVPIIAIELVKPSVKIIPERYKGMSWLENIIHQINQLTLDRNFKIQLFHKAKTEWDLITSEDEIFDLYKPAKDRKLKIKATWEILRKYHKNLISGVSEPQTAEEIKYIFDRKRTDTKGKKLILAKVGKKKDNMKSQSKRKPVITGYVTEEIRKIANERAESLGISVGDYLTRLISNDHQLSSGINAPPGHPY